MRRFGGIRCWMTKADTWFGAAARSRGAAAGIVPPRVGDHRIRCSGVSEVGPEWEPGAAYMPPGRNRARVLAYADSRVYGGAEAYFCRLVRALARSPRLELSAAAPEEASAVSAGLGEAVGNPPVQVPSQGTRLSALHLYDPRRLVAVRHLLASVPHDVLLVNLPSAEYGATP